MVRETPPHLLAPNVDALRAQMREFAQRLTAIEEKLKTVRDVEELQLQVASLSHRLAAVEELLAMGEEAGGD